MQPIYLNTMNLILKSDNNRNSDRATCFARKCICYKMDVSNFRLVVKFWRENKTHSTEILVFER